MGRILLLDPSVAGISGNMVLGCLLDLGAAAGPLEELARVVSREMGEEVFIERRRVRRYGFAAQWADWKLPKEEGEVPGMRFLQQLKATSKALELSTEARGFALKAGRILVDAEAAVHDTTPEKVHFHELGSVDTVLDILGTALLLDLLGFPRPGAQVYSTPVAVGKGPIDVSHGHLPVPPYVTTEVLRAYSIPYHMSTAEGELATPTGVAILAALVEGFDPLFTIRPEAVGYGAGGRDISGVPNVLKAVLGSSGPPGEEVVSVLETNLDDVTGEVLGHLAGILSASAALDFHMIPTVTKKNRPGHILQVIAPPGKEEQLAAIIMRETGSLGVRVNRLQRRLVLDRELVRAKVQALGGEEVTFKVARDSEGNVVSVKPELDDLREVAGRMGITLREAKRRAEAVELHGKS
ncbi:MAG: nickel pincer cofactor biosynthesis protein LarC [Thermoplasmata archaeon]